MASRYYADSIENVVRDSVNDHKVIRDFQDGAPLVFANREDTLWYAEQLNGMRTREEIFLGI
jgi:hypothetical protein